MITNVDQPEEITVTSLSNECMIDAHSKCRIRQEVRVKATGGLVKWRCMCECHYEIPKNPYWERLNDTD